MTPLRQRMIEDMQVRNLSPHTQSTYVLQVSLFARYFSKPPDQLGPEEIRAYQVHLTNEKKLAPSSILIAVSALRFLYKVTLHKDWSVGDIIPTPKKPQKLPIVLSPEEVLHFLNCVASPKHRTILTTCYAAGLRVSEAVRLKPAEIDSQRIVIRVDQGKGQKDRYVMLSPRLLELLRDWWRLEKPKPWLFPGNIPGRHITTGTVELACQEAHRASRIPKPITPHSMRYVLSFNYVLSFFFLFGLSTCFFSCSFINPKIAFPFYFLLAWFVASGTRRIHLAGRAGHACRRQAGSGQEGPLGALSRAGTRQPLISVKRSA